VTILQYKNTRTCDYTAIQIYENMLYCSHVWMAPGNISC